MSEILLTLRESKASPVGSRFQAICALGDISTKTAKTGSTYYEAVIADATDDIKIRVFGDSPVKPVLVTLKAGAVVRVGGPSPRSPTPSVRIRRSWAASRPSRSTTP